MGLLDAPFVNRTELSNLDFLNPYSVKSMTTLLAALNAGTCKVAHVGHSITEGMNENWFGATQYELRKRLMRQAFPSVTFNHCNFGLGGAKVADFADRADTTGVVSTNTSVATVKPFYRPANSSGRNRTSWIDDGGTFNGATTNGKSWRNYVLGFAPDLVFLQFDLNDWGVTTAAFKASYQSIIDDFNSHADWSAKRPSLVLVASHIGVTDQVATRKIMYVVRELARVNNLPLIDAARIYDILTTGYDVMTRQVNAEAYFRYDGSYNSTTAYNLNTAYWHNLLGTGRVSAGGVLSDSGGSYLFALRKRLARNVMIGGMFACYSSTPKPTLMYRANPTSTGASTYMYYYAQISGSTLGLYYRDNVGTVTTIATTTLSAALANGINVRMDVIANDCRHVVKIDGVIKLDVTDYNDLSEGWAGFGDAYYSMSGGWYAGTATQNCAVIEYYDAVRIAQPKYTDAGLCNSVSDFATNPDSEGGSGGKHLKTNAYEIVYAPPTIAWLKQVQAAFA